MLPIARFLKTNRSDSNVGMGKHTCSSVHTDERPRAKRVLVPDMFVVLFIFYEKPIDESSYLFCVTFIGSKAKFHWAAFLIYYQSQCLYTQCVGTYIAPLRTKFRMPSSNCLLVNAPRTWIRSKFLSASVCSGLHSAENIALTKVCVLPVYVTVNIFLGSTS